MRVAYRRGFTLIELLVVIMIMALLIAILLPVLSKARDQAKTMACASTLRQFLLGSYAYASDHGGSGLGVGQVHFYIYRVSTNWRHRVPFVQLTAGNDIYVAGEEAWRCPADLFAWEDTRNVFGGPYITSYGWYRKEWGPAGFNTPTSPWRIEDIKRPTKSALFGDASWERVPQWDYGHWHGEGYNVGFVDGHAAWYADNGMQGRARMEVDW